MTDLYEIVTLNGKQHWAIVDRAKRQIVFKGDVLVTLTDAIVVIDMTGPINAVEHDERCTVVTLGG